MPGSMRIAVLLLAVGLWLSGVAVADDLPSVTIEALIHGRRFEGMPVSVAPELVRLLGRDGRLLEIEPSEATQARQTADHFRGFSAAELRGQLQGEFGNRLEVTGTGHYLVVHPAGEGGAWAERFEDLYRSFVHYFRVRGFRLAEPQYPLVAIVWNRREDFVRYASEQGYPASAGLLGYYALESNRITLYNRESAGKGGGGWQQNAATIIHEATHQTAFNTGVHNRFAPPPRWLAEGLGMMFESPGVYDSRHHEAQATRIHRARLQQFRGYLRAGRRPLAFVELLNSDLPFQTHTDAAYCESWALAFYLCETQPRKFSDYLARTAARPRFAPYPAARRLADFTAVFGDNLPMLEARYLEFVAGLK